MTQRIQNLTLPQREALHSAPAPDLECHSRKCAICNHPQREAIDAAFVRWHSPGEIMEGYDLDFGYAALYRHSHATGLTELRSRNLLPALEHIIESAEQTTPTAAGVISAIRAYVCLTNPGQWNEPPRRVSIDYNIHNASQPVPQPMPVAPPPIPPDLCPRHPSPPRIPPLRAAPSDSPAPAPSAPRRARAPGQSHLLFRKEVFLTRFPPRIALNRLFLIENMKN